MDGDGMNAFLKDKQHVPSYKCGKCGTSYPLFAEEILYGLWYEGKLIRCKKCHAKMKYDFWKKLAIEEDGTI